MGIDNRAFVLTEAISVSGEYIVDGYENNKNNWHYVTINENEQGGYTWKNKAGVKWTLSWKDESQKELVVGTDCPYSSHGYKLARLKHDANGNVTAIQGPGNEWYKKEAS
jgi:hypothetical protein